MGKYRMKLRSIVCAAALLASGANVALSHSNQPKSVAPIDTGEAYKVDEMLAKKAQITVNNAFFFVKVTSPDGQSKTVITNNVPYVPKHVCYGWIVHLDGDDRLVKFTEIYTSSSAPEIWSGEDNPYGAQETSADRKSTRTEKFITTYKGWIENSWCVDEGDPLGAHKMEVHVDGQHVKTFDFQMVEKELFQVVDMQ